MDFNALFQDFMYAAVVALAAIVVKYLVGLAQTGIDFVKEKISTIKNDDFRKYCEDMMNAAETMTKELISGTEKKEWVIEKLKAYAAEKNISVTDEQISNLVQAIFQELDGITLNKYKTEISTESISDIIAEAVNEAFGNVVTGGNGVVVEEIK